MVGYSRHGTTIQNEQTTLTVLQKKHVQPLTLYQEQFLEMTPEYEIQANTVEEALIILSCYFMNAVFVIAKPIEMSIDGYTFEDEEYILDFNLGEPISVGRIDLREDLRSSQRVELFEVWVKDGGNWVLIGDSTVIGNRRTLLFEDCPVTSRVRIVIRQSRSVPVLRSVEIFAAQ